MGLKEFIEVTSIYDGKKARIRAACIDAVIDNAEEVEKFHCNGVCVFSSTTKPACMAIHYNGCVFDAAESYDDICGMIYDAEL